MPPLLSVWGSCWLVCKMGHLCRVRPVGLGARTWQGAWSSQEASRIKSREERESATEAQVGALGHLVSTECRPLHPTEPHRLGARTAPARSLAAVGPELRARGGRAVLPPEAAAGSSGLLLPGLAGHPGLRPPPSAALDSLCPCAHGRREGHWGPSWRIQERRLFSRSFT